jgi:hypothetical protein
MTKATEDARYAELRALGPTHDDFDGPGSCRPASLERCWRTIELLDAELSQATECEMRAQREARLLR